MPTSSSSISMKKEFKGVQSKTPTPDLFMRCSLSSLSLNRRRNYFSLFLSDIISIVIINEKQQSEFGKLLMVSIIRRADSSHVQLSLVTVWKCSGETGTVDTESEPCVCVALPSRICMHSFSLSHPKGLYFHAEGDWNWEQVSLANGGYITFSILNA